MEWGTCGRHLENTIERSVLGGEAGCCCHHCSNLLDLVTHSSFRISLNVNTSVQLFL